MNLVVAVARRQHSNLRSPVSSPNAGATGGASANGVRRDHDAAGIARSRTSPKRTWGARRLAHTSESGVTGPRGQLCFASPEHIR